MIIRSGGYEVKQIDALNWGVFRVYEDPSTAPKRSAIRRIADDGAVLDHTGTYHGSMAEALRGAHKLALADGADGSEFASLADLVEESERRVSELAERIGAVARDA